MYLEKRTLILYILIIWLWGGADFFGRVLLKGNLPAFPYSAEFLTSKIRGKLTNFLSRTHQLALLHNTLCHMLSTILKFGNLPWAIWVRQQLKDEGTNVLVVVLNDCFECFLIGGRINVRRNL